MDPLKVRIGVIVGSTRPHRRARSVGEWICAASSPECELTLVDLAEADLPLLSEPAPAAFGQYTLESTRAWSKLIDEFDGYVLVSPEYNHSTSAALKNALDHLYAEWRDKPVAFASYGFDGGVRATEHLRAITAELGMAGIGPQVALSVADDFDQHDCAPGPRRVEARDRMLADLLRWAVALRPLRPAPASTHGPRPALADAAGYAGARAAAEQLVAQLQAAGEALDADRYDAMFAADVVWGSPYGRALAGYDQVNAAHRGLMQREREARAANRGDLPPTSRFEIVHVLAPAPGVAVAQVRRRAIAEQGEPPGFSEMTMYTLVERDGRWWLAAGQNTPIADRA